MASRALPLLAPRLLRRRLKLGKEDASRWREKLAEPTQSRPSGPLVWLHAVGLGEVLALRGLITSMAEQRQDLSFVVTSSARSSAHVMGANLPDNTQHQFLPIDSPQYVRRFINHWDPDLSIWSEQDFWPVAITEAYKRSIPLAVVNARITAKSFERRKIGRALYRAILSRMSLIAAQEEDTAARLMALGARDVRVTGSLKSAAPPLGHDPASLIVMETCTKRRKLWLAVSTHRGDEAQAIAAQQALFAKDPANLLILIPRNVSRVPEIVAALNAANLPHSRRSAALPAPDEAVYVVDTYGELGLFYRLAKTAFIGGGFDDIGGHNPWEAAALETAILFGPDTHNFVADYSQLREAHAALCIPPGALAEALTNQALPEMAQNAHSLWKSARSSLAPLASDLLGLMKDEL